MATFEYSALTSMGRLMKGTIEARSTDEAGQFLQQLGLNINSLEKAAPTRLKTAVGRSEFLLFNQQLASITKAGIPLERGLRELAGDVSSKSMRKLVEGIADELEAGVSIEEAFEKRQKNFPPLYGLILKAGVETGRLSEMLTSLNRHLELANQTRRIIFEAVSYPLVVLTLAAVIVSGLFLFIIPQFAQIISEMIEGRLNPVSALVLSMPRNVVPFWITIGCLVGGGILLSGLLSASPAGRRAKESIFIRIPLLGKIYHSSVLSRMAEAMALMVGAGCDMPACLRLAAGATGSERLILESETLAGQMERGVNILEAGQFCRMIPKLFLLSAQMGAQRNELQDNLYSLAQMYAEQARCGQMRLQTVLLPIMLIGVGGIIMITILGIFLPMVQVITSLSS
jgi:type II secretory pathway component PulF